ncbi:MAG: hypothetical protein AABY64_08270 [Bdellovibrionota bacterium]
MAQFFNSKKFTTIVIFCLGLNLLMSLGCQQGKKEDGASQAYADVLEKCDLIEKELADQKVFLKESPLKPSEIKKLNFTLAVTQDENKIQLLLEQYIITSQKLLEAADTKVVLFPEKDRIQQSLNNAIILLGHLYAKTDESRITPAIRNKKLDYSEFSYRFARLSFFLKTLKDLNLPIDDSAASLVPMKKLTQDQLVSIVDMSEVIGVDLLRIKILCQRNKNWEFGNAFDAFAEEDSSRRLSGLYWRYGEQAKNTLNSRGKNSEKNKSPTP